MRDRLLLGPVLIAMLILGVMIDQSLDKRPMPPWLRDVIQEVPFVHTARGTFPPGTVVLPMMVVISVLAARELAVMARAKGIDASRRVMGIAAGIGLLTSTVIPAGIDPGGAAAMVSTGAVVTLVMSLLFYSRHRNVTGVMAATGITLLAFVYLGVTFGFLLAIRREHSAWVLLWVLLVTKACDIGAYFTGKGMGRHKLVYWLSPGKTWEGLVGGVVLSCVVSVWGLSIMAGAGQVPWPGWTAGVVAGVVFALVGQAGDLAKSLFKRDAGLKDSGAALPGFGGIIDVIDSPILVTPIAFWWLRLFVS